MAITRVQLATSGSISASAAGNLLIVWQRGDTTAPTDNISSTYSTYSSANTNGIITIGYLLNTASGITTVTAGGTGTILAVAEYTGGTGTFSTDAANPGSSTGTGTLVSPTVATSLSSFTPGANNELVIGGLNIVRTAGTTSVTVVALPTSFTADRTVTGTNASGCWEWIQTTATATTLTSNCTRSATTNTTYNWADVIAAFIFTASGGGGTQPFMQMLLGVY